MNNFIFTLKQFVKKIPYSKKIISGLISLMSKYTVHNIALGFAIGVFWGVFPTFGTAGIWAIITAQIFKASKLAAIIGTLISNPLTAPFFYGLGAILGSLIAGISYSSDKFLSSILELGIGLTFFKLILGFVLVALFFSIIFYFIVYAISDRYQKKKLEKAIKNTYTISLD